MTDTAPLLAVYLDNDGIRVDGSGGDISINTYGTIFAATIDAVCESLVRASGGLVDKRACRALILTEIVRQFDEPGYVNSALDRKLN